MKSRNEPLKMMLKINPCGPQQTVGGERLIAMGPAPKTVESMRAATTAGKSLQQLEPKFSLAR